MIEPSLKTQEKNSHQISAKLIKSQAKGRQRVIKATMNESVFAQTVILFTVIEILNQLKFMKIHVLIKLYLIFKGSSCYSKLTKMSSSNSQFKKLFDTDVFVSSP